MGILLQVFPFSRWSRRITSLKLAFILISQHGDTWTVSCKLRSQTWTRHRSCTSIPQRSFFPFSLCIQSRQTKTRFLINNICVSGKIFLYLTFHLGCSTSRIPAWWKSLGFGSFFHTVNSITRNKKPEITLHSIPSSLSRATEHELKGLMKFWVLVPFLGGGGGHRYLSVFPANSEMHLI